MEDDQVNKTYTKEVLRGLSTKTCIYEASNGREAIAQFERHRPDLILMDIQMPHKDGYQATKVIRKIPGSEKTIITALTAADFEEEKQKYKDSHMDDFMGKPLTKAILEKKLNQWFSKSTLNKTLTYRNRQNKS